MSIIEKIVDDAYRLYMPQVRSEIIGLAEFVFHRGMLSFIEIGTKNGGTFQILNEIANLNCDWAFRTEGFMYSGPRISIDLPAGNHGGISLELIEKRNLYFNERYHCNFILGDSHKQETKDELSQLLKNRCVDFLFIDGDHSYEGVKQDFEMYSEFVTAGGLIAFHDINDTQRHRDRGVYVGKFWQEIKSKYKNWEFNANEDWAGIGVIQI